MPQISPIKFSRELQSQLFPDNSFYKKSRTETGIGPDVENVEIPVAGNVGKAKSGDPASLPLVIKEREDTKKSYPVEQLYTDPYLVRREEEIVVNYAKLQDLANSLGLSINERAADIAAVNWASIINVVQTSGGTARATTLTGSTGTRKPVAKADMLAVRNKFNKMNLPSMGRDDVWGLLTPDQVDDLLNIAEFVDFDKTGELSKLKNGEIGYVMGMNLLQRYNSEGCMGVIFNKLASAINTIDEVVAADDNAGATFWHKGMVRHAEGNAATFIDRGKPEYLGGTLLASVVRFGATYDRPDNVGIVSMYETWVT